MLGFFFPCDTIHFVDILKTRDSQSKLLSPDNNQYHDRFLNRISKDIVSEVQTHLQHLLGTPYPRNRKVYEIIN